MDGLDGQGLACLLITLDCGRFGLWRFNLPVAGDGLEVTVVSAEGDVESDDGLAGLDEVEVLLIDASLVGGVVVEELDLLKETRLTMIIELRAELCLGSEGARLSNYAWQRRDRRVRTLLEQMVGGRAYQDGRGSWERSVKVFA